MSMRKDDFTRGSVSSWETGWEGRQASFDPHRPVDDWGYFDVFRAAHLFDTLVRGKAQLILECGCGSASTSAYFSYKGARPIMLDAAQSALRLARENFRKFGLQGCFINADMESLPFKDDCFDLVMSFGALEHFADMGPSLRAMWRVLKPGGRLFTSVAPRRPSVQTAGDLFNGAMRFLYNLKHARFKKAFLDSYPPRKEYFENDYSSQCYRVHVERCGFTGIRLWGARPFPNLDLPRWLFPAYLACMRALKPAHRFFDTHPSKFTELFGTEWNIIATKPLTR